MTIPQLLSPAEAAVALGVSRSMIYKLIAQGDLPTLKVGRARRIPADALERFVEEGLRPCPEEAIGALM